MNRNTAVAKVVLIRISALIKLMIIKFRISAAYLAVFTTSIAMSPVSTKAQRSDIRIYRSASVIYRCVIDIEPEQPATVDRVYVKFVSSKGVSVHVMPLEGFSNTIIVQRTDFLRNGRQQILLSATMGRIVTYIYDFDGRVARLVYSREDGRVRVKMVKNRRGGWMMSEIWPENQYEDGEGDLGLAWLSDHGCVRRYLHWNGTTFVQNHPGSTRIVLVGRPPEDIRE